MSVTETPRTTDPIEFRIEHDTMGEVQVPALAKYGAQTQRAVQNFDISSHRLSRHHIAALAQIKRAAAIANGELGLFDAQVAGAIVSAADEVIAGKWDGEFPIDVFQTGSGTSSNMNANEVIARLAAERLGAPVHPNDQVNASQSSNDAFPASIHIAATEAVVTVLVPALTHLAEALEAKASEFADVARSRCPTCSPVRRSCRARFMIARSAHEGVDRVTLSWAERAITGKGRRGPVGARRSGLLAGLAATDQGAQHPDNRFPSVSQVDQKAGVLIRLLLHGSQPLFKSAHRAIVPQTAQATARERRQNNVTRLRRAPA
jgi:Lyase